MASQDLPVYVMDSSTPHSKIRQWPPFLEVGKELSLDEDKYTEFKGHRSFSLEEIPPKCLRASKKKLEFEEMDVEPDRRIYGISWNRPFFMSKQSRQPVSKTLNAFLNTGQGGTVLLGVTDDGIVRGIKLTQYQKDHVKLSLEDLFGRFNPVVPKSKYRLSFYPVFDENSTTEEMTSLLNYKEPVDKKYRRRNHKLRTHVYCFCDTDAKAALTHGNIYPSYVIDVTVLPWDSASEPLEESLASLHLSSTEERDLYPRIIPLYENEEGKVYVRRQASVISLTKQQVYGMTMQRVHDFYRARQEKCGERREALWRRCEGIVETNYALEKD